MSKYEVFNLDTDESHGIYDTLDEARGCVLFDKLTRYSIWKDESVRVECCDPVFEGEDEEPYDTPSLDEHPMEIFRRGEMADETDGTVDYEDVARRERAIRRRRGEG